MVHPVRAKKLQQVLIRRDIGHEKLTPLAGKLPTLSALVVRHAHIAVSIAKGFGSYSSGVHFFPQQPKRGYSF